MTRISNHTTERWSWFCFRFYNKILLFLVNTVIPKIVSTNIKDFQRSISVPEVNDDFAADNDLC